MAEYLNRRPYRMEATPGESPHLLNYTLHLEEPVPPSLSVIVGDLLHNLRSALDAFAFELARTHYGPGLDGDDGLQEISGFPIVAARDELDAWIGRRRRRGELFGDDQLTVLHWIQSTYWSERGAEALGQPYDRELTRSMDPLSRLTWLHNLDKHRRLVIAAFAPDVPSWGSNGVVPSQRQFRGLARFPWADGQLVAVVYDPPSEAGDTDINWDLKLGLVDDLPNSPMLDTLTGFVGTVEHTIMSGVHFTLNPPAPGGEPRI